MATECSILCGFARAPAQLVKNCAIYGTRAKFLRVCAWKECKGAGNILSAHYQECSLGCCPMIIAIVPHPAVGVPAQKEAKEQKLSGAGQLQGAGAMLPKR